MPFTTPALAGSRVRPAERVGLELIVPNPSGGRGDYVLPWTGLRSICRPTVHDVMLTERIVRQRCATPASIRSAAFEIAAQGLAGHAASTAALTARQDEGDAQLYTNFHLLVHLVQQAEPPGALVPAEQASPTELEHRAKRTIAVVAPRLQQDAETIATSLEELAKVYAPIGLGARANRARLPHAIASLKLLRKDISAFPVGVDDGLLDSIQIILSTADATIRYVEITMTEARAAADHLLKLLAAWRVDPMAVGRQLARPDWLMDGWERICKLWSLAQTLADKREAIEEIASLVPVIPREAGEWAGIQLEVAQRPRTKRFVMRHEDWRTGLCVFDTIARNEALLSA